MSLLVLVPRAMCRKTINAALIGPSNMLNMRAPKSEHATPKRLLHVIAEAAEDTEALLGELRA